jgi:hypothetical protein
VALNAGGDNDFGGVKTDLERFKELCEPFGMIKRDEIDLMVMYDAQGNKVGHINCK